MKVEIHRRWVLLFASCVVLLILREHRLLLTLYVAVVVAGLLLYAFWLPRRVAAAETRFHREALRLLASGDHDGLRALAGRQWLLRRFGRPHVIPHGLALAAGAAGDREAERRHYLEALRSAPGDERTRIELNLAGAELATGHLDAAEGRYRAVLRRRPDLSVAVAGLGRVLLAKGESLDEAADLLRRAVEASDARERPALQLALAEALVRSGQTGWETLLEAARASGAVSADEVSRVEVLASSQSATRG